MKKFFTRTFLLVLALAVISPNIWAINIVKPTSTEPDPVAVKAAFESFKNLTKKEKKERFKELKSEIKAFKAAKKAHKETSTSTLLQVIIAILLPPLGVYLHEGVINSKFWIDLVLTLLFYFPGLIYALIVILGNNNR